MIEKADLPKLWLLNNPKPLCLRILELLVKFLRMMTQMMKQLGMCLLLVRPPQTVKQILEITQIRR